MGSVVDTVTQPFEDVVNTVGDIGQSVIDAGSQVVDTVSTAVSDVAQTVSDAGVSIDKAVNDNIPGGWATVGAVALTIASAGTVDLEGETMAADVAVNGTVGSASGTGVGLTSGAVDSALAEGLSSQTALEAAGEGAVKGAAIGATKSALTGGDPLQGALTGAVAGGIGAGVGSYASGLTQGTDLADYSKLVGSVAGGTAAGAGSAAVNGRDPLTGALIGGITGGTSAAASNLLPTDVNPAITSAGLGAIKSALMGGDPLTGALTSAGGSLVNQGVGAGYDAVKGGLSSTDGTQTADNTNPTQYAPLASNTTSDQPTPLVPSNTQGVSVSQAAFTSPYILDANGNLMYDSNGQPIPNPLANQSSLKEGVTSTANQGAPLSQSQIDAANQLESKLSSGEISQAEYDKQLAAIENQTPSPLDTALNATISGSSNTNTGGLPTNNTPAPSDIITNDTGQTGRFVTQTGPNGQPYQAWQATDANGTPLPVTPLPSPTVGDGSGSGGSGVVVSGSGDGSGNGTGTGGTSTGTGGTGTGTGSGGTGSGTGTGLGGLGSTLATTAQQIQNQSATSGLTNLTPGLTKSMNSYSLAGLPSINEAPVQEYSTGGAASSTSSSSLFDSQGNYNYGNTSETPLTVGLTKHNVGYALTGLPSFNKAEGGLIAHMAGGGQFGSGGNYFGSSGNFGTNEKPEYPQEAEHKPQFYSEGGASLAHRYVTGAGDGTSDSVPAMLANGEFVIPADIVSNLGNGSNDSGAKILDEFLRVIREHKRKAGAKHLPPDSKGPLSYLTDAKRKVRK